MFEAKATGLNLNYGKKGEVRTYGDTHFLTALKNGWVEATSFKYVGVKADASFPKVTAEEKLMPLHKVDFKKVVEMQSAQLKIMAERIWRMQRTNERLLKLIK